jgi:protein phosphatase 2C-like protein
VKGDSFYAIGDPGRAALELIAGPPATPIGYADVELSSVSLPGMLIVAASSRGLEHRATGTPRQDAFALSHRADGDTAEAVAVVCDGVGAFSRSAEAAMLVSHGLANLGAVGVPWAEAFPRVNAELCKAAEELRATGPAGDGMATTAVAASVRREENYWVGEVAWAGDSTLWHLGPGGQWRPITGQPDDEIEPVYHSADVMPLPSTDGACTSAEFRIADGALFLMSDGVANPLRWSRDVQETLAGWWGRPADPFTFAAQVGFARKSHLDDRTVVGIWPSEDA